MDLADPCRAGQFGAAGEREEAAPRRGPSACCHAPAWAACSRRIEIRRSTHRLPATTRSRRRDRDFPTEEGRGLTMGRGGRLKRCRGDMEGGVAACGWSACSISWLGLDGEDELADRSGWRFTARWSAPMDTKQRRRGRWCGGERRIWVSILDARRVPERR
jgi:hypothetical protein